MRKQYHLRRGEDGFDAWDVDRLIELTDGKEVNQVALASITEIDSVYWFGDSGERATVRKVVQHIRLIRGTDLSHPIILDADGRVMDGMRRPYSRDTPTSRPCSSTSGLSGLRSGRASLRPVAAATSTLSDWLPQSGFRRITACCS